MMMSENNNGGPPAGDVSPWVRQGECIACGDCCRQATNCAELLLPIKDEAYGRVRFGAPVPAFIGKVAEPVFLIRAPMWLPCPKLEGDLCSIHESKPNYCKITPCAPEDIEGLPRCSYWFVNQETGEVKGNVPGVQS